MSLNRLNIYITSHVVSHTMSSDYPCQCFETWLVENIWSVAQKRSWTRVHKCGQIPLKYQILYLPQGIWTRHGDGVVMSRLNDRLSSPSCSKTSYSQSINKHKCSGLSQFTLRHEDNQQTSHHWYVGQRSEYKDLNVEEGVLN